MITVKVTYSDGNTVTTSINGSFQEAEAYFKSFPRITECFITGKESAAKVTSVELVP
jgi:hypothetical protein